MDPKKQLLIRSRKAAREIVEQIDGLDSCVNCGVSQYTEVHHIDGDALNNHPMNLAPLCYPCHKRVHKMKRTTEDIKGWKGEVEQLADN